jgi:hypothetical protein
MGASPIDDRKWARYCAGVARGLSSLAAAREAGIGYSTVNRALIDPTSRLMRVMSDMGLGNAGILPLENLSPNAQRAVNDFGFFRSYYLARSTSPWAEEAAMRMVELASTVNKEYVVVNLPPGSGKDVALDTPLLTPSGWTTMGEIKVGDEVFDDSGKPTRVVAKSEIFYDHECFEVRTDDGASVIAGADHEWPVRLDGLGQYKNFSKPWYPGKTGPKPSGGVRFKTTADLMKHRTKRPQLAVAPALEFPGGKVRLPLNPYLLGVWLGDGHSYSGQISQSDEDAAWLIPEIQRLGYEVTRNKAPQVFKVTRLSKQLRKLGVFKNKYIPEIYFLSNKTNRLALLQGLIDTDGHVAENGSVEFCNTNYDLARGVQRLVHSLGAKASITESRATLRGKDCGPRWRVAFYLKDAARLPRKSERTRNGIRTPSRYLTATPVPTVPTQCIQVENDSHCYLVGSGLMVTHNSTIFAHDIPVWLAVRNRAQRCMIGSSTERMARMYTGRIRATFERTLPVRADAILKQLGTAFDAKTTLVADFGRFKPPDANVWRREEFIIAQHGGQSVEGKEPSFVAYGRDSGFLGGRFDLVIWDDLVTNATLRTEEGRDDLAKWFQDEAEFRVDPRGLLILQGQRLASNDLYRAMLNQLDVTDEFDDKPEEAPKKYHHIVYKAHYEDLCKQEHGTIKHPAKPYPDGCLLDPYRLPWRDLQKVKINKAERFNILFQQEDTDPENSLVQRVWIDGGTDTKGRVSVGCWDENRSIGQIPKDVTGYSVVTADPSPTKFWAICWWIFEPETQTQYLIDLVRQPMDAPDFLDWSLGQRMFTGLLEDWQQRSVALGKPITHLIVEKNAAQRFLLQYDFFKRWSTRNSVQLTAHETTRNKTDETYGVQTLAPHYRDGRVRLPGNHFNGSKQAVMPLVNEVVHWPNGTTDDCVMSHWFLIWNAPHLFLPATVNPVAFDRPSWMQNTGGDRWHRQLANR